MNLLPFPYVPLSKRCTECGEWKLTADLRDGWCSLCLGENPERVVQLRPAELEPEDWWLAGCTWPGVGEGPWTFARANELAKKWGGRVLPWSRREFSLSKPKALGVFPNYGANHRGER